MTLRVRSLFVFLLCVCAALAQNTAGVGSISGVVRDASGAVVPNAKVTISNTSNGVSRTLNTTDAGIFSAGALVPAAGYSVKVTAPGFADWELKDAELQVGQSLDLKVMLQVASATTQVQITAEAPLVESTKTDVSAVIDSKQIQELPINGRRVDSFVLLTPGVSNDGTFGLLTFRGVAGGNAFLVDGNDTTEQFYNENAGRTRIASQLSQDAVQEFQVLSSNFSAEYGRAMGGVVNTVTRSGTNDLHGTVYWFFRNQTLNARDRYATLNPKEYRHQVGGSIGGNIIKDKLFYFFNTEIQRRKFPIESSLVRPSVITNGQFVPYSAATPLGCGVKATAAQCAAIQSLLPRFFGELPRRNDQTLAFGKLDWRPSDRNSFSASFNFLRFLAPNGLLSQSATTDGSAINGNGNDSVRVRNGRLSWTSIPTSSAVNEARFNWFTDRQADDFVPGSVPAGLGYLQLTVAGQNLSGGLNYLPRVSPNENRYGFADNLSWTKGKHALKFGVDIAHNEDYEYFQFNRFGSYSYANVDNFALDFSGNTTGAKNWTSYAQGFGSPIVDVTVVDYGFFAQDQWRITPNLTFNYGVRYEYSSVEQPSKTNPDYPQTAHIPVSNEEFMPRLGLAYNFDKQKMVLRVGYGIFFARYQTGLISNLFQNNAVLQTSLSLTGATQAALGPVYPNILATAAGAKGSTTVQFAAPNLRAPYTEQGSIALDKQLTHDIALTASYIWSRGVQLLTVRDLNMGPQNGPVVTYTIKDAGGNTTGTYSTPTYLFANRVDPRYGRILQDENGYKSYYNSLAVNLTKRFAKGFSGSVAYTWGHEIDYGVGGGSSNLFYSGVVGSTNGDWKVDKGSGSLDQRHRLGINFVEQPTFTHRSGALYKYLVNNWQLATITVLASGRPATPSVSIGDNTPFPGAAYTSTLNGYGGWSRVPFVPTAYLYTPPVYRVDARISKVLPFNDRFRAYLNFEAFNVTNTVVDTSLRTGMFTERGGVLTPTLGFDTGSASAGFPDGTNARRAQVSARLVF